MLHFWRGFGTVVSAYMNSISLNWTYLMHVVYVRSVWRATCTICPDGGARTKIRVIKVSTFILWRAGTSTETCHSYSSFLNDERVKGCDVFYFLLSVCRQHSQFSPVQSSPVHTVSAMFRPLKIFLTATKCPPTRCCSSFVSRMRFSI